MIYFAILGGAVVLILGLDWLADRRRRGWDTSRDSRHPGDLYSKGKGAQITSTNHQIGGGSGGL